MDIKKLNISNLKLAKYNPRKELKPGDDGFNKLKKSIETYGEIVPIVVNKNMTVISGHQRIAVLKNIGISEVYAVIVDLDDSNEKALNIAMNKVQGDWDYDALNTLLNELNSDLDDIEITGFSLDELDGILVMDRNEFFVGNNKKKCRDVYKLYAATADKDKALRFAQLFGCNELRLDKNNRMTIKLGDK